MLRSFPRLASALLVAWSAPASIANAADSTPTFTRDIAPIVFSQCVECHHAGGIAPFSLTTYRDVAKRAKMIVRVTGERLMPPWPPEPGFGEFVGERRLTEAQLATLDKWSRTGLTEGSPRDLPPLPTFRDGWKLGEPDLIVTPPKAFSLPAAGPDVYRNLVMPYAATTNRHVRAIEFHPGKTSAVHHAFVLVDESGDARRLEGLETQPGFGGMLAGRGARAPGGFVSWQPGRRPVESPDGMAWPLKQGCDLVLQLHLRPTGKPEAIQPRVGLYFTDQAPTRPYMMLLLRPAAIDIPAGESSYAVESSYKLATDVKLIGLAPHLHYLGREARGWATLPDGTRRELIYIKRWDFNWQGDYRYFDPVVLPKGTTLHMRFTYDNSAANPSNPNQPPQRVQYGLQSSDEMGELWFWIETNSAAELQTLQRDYFGSWGLADKIAVNEALLARDPRDAMSRTELAAAFIAKGRIDEAIAHLQQAARDNAKLPRTFYVLGTVLARRGELADAEAAFTQAVAIDPGDAKAQNNLGTVLLSQGKAEAAVAHFEAAVRLAPDDALARQGLEKARAAAVGR